MKIDKDPMQWNEEQITEVLTNLSNLDKTKVWLRKDLSVSPSSLLGRIAFVVLGWIPWIKHYCFNIDMEASKKLLSQLEFRAFLLKNRQIDERIERAVARINTIASKKYETAIAPVMFSYEMGCMISFVENEISKRKLNEDESNLLRKELLKESFMKFLKQHPSVVHFDLRGSGANLVYFLECLSESKRDVQFLDMDSSIEDRDLLFLKNFPNLIFLNLEGCKKITDAGILNLASLSNLVHLNMKKCKRITDQGMVHVSKFKKLRHLNVAHCPDITDRGIIDLSKNTRLRELNIASCNITDDSVRALGKLSSLEFLSLEDCEEVTDEGIAYLSALNLRSLNIAWCSKVTNKSIPGFKNSSSLERLNLVGTEIANKDLTPFLDPECTLTHLEVTTATPEQVEAFAEKGIELTQRKMRSHL